MKRLIYFLMVMVVFGQCVPENKKILTEVNIDLSNPEIKRLLGYQNKQETDSIIGFINHEDPSFRYLACNAFSSYQDPLVLKQLYGKLNDPVLKVRTAAAYAIGQIGKARSVDSLVMAFKPKDTISVDNEFNSTILEAVGKTGLLKHLNLISTANTYRPTDSLLLLGQARSIYRFMLRDIISPEGTSKMIELLTSETTPNEVKMIAANYLARSKDVDISPFKFQINQVFSETEDLNIKMALTLALGRLEDTTIQDNLVSQLKLKRDYRLTCNIIRALDKQSYIKVAEQLLEKLSDPNRHIALTAANYFVRNGNKDDASFYRNYARDTLHHAVKSKMYEATLVNLPYYYSNTRNATRYLIQKEFEEASSLEEKKSYIEALSHDPVAHEWLYNNVYKSEDSGLKTACIQAFGTMLLNEHFEFFFKARSNRVRNTILSYLKEGIESGDEGIIGSAADIISNERSQLKGLIDSTQFLQEALSKLKSPGQLESINAVEKALGYLSNQPNIDLSSAQIAKDLNWTPINEMGDSLQALIRTTKGVFIIELFTKDSPESVLNFVELSNADFYDEKIFHRVVPNFVIQTGSPRADNYGGKDYVIRSELSMKYYDQEGYVGMASAGPHTESTQWFITHSPTPHLDGRYTIFGKVTSGMDVVHNIFEGDKIEEIVISNL